MFNKKFNSTSVEYIIVGLGNPDKKYEMTRHNAGFIAVDFLAEEFNCPINKLKFKGYTGITEIDGHKVLFLKPQTYMNNSGESVVEAMEFYKVKPENVIVIFDDISLDVGKMRIRSKGSDGGQKGMRSIIYLSGKDTFPRIKIGIGKKPNENWDLADWVLSKFSDQDYNLLKETIKNVVPAVKDIMNNNILSAMNKFN